MYFLFDIDGTLTPPRQKMEGGYAMSFLSWMANKNVYLVTGSDRKKILQQDETIISNIHFLYFIFL